MSEVFSFVSYLCDKISIQTSIDCDKIVIQTSIDVIFTFDGENCLRRTEVFRMKMFCEQKMNAVCKFTHTSKAVIQKQLLLFRGI